MTVKQGAGVLVWRTISFQEAAFDKLKAWQRGMEQRHGRPVTNSEALAAMLENVPKPPQVPPRLR